MPNEPIELMANTISNTVQSIIEKSRPSASTRGEINRAHFELFIRLCARYDVLSPIEICVGLTYIDIIFDMIKQKAVQIPLPVWMEGIDMNTIFTQADEFICVTAMMLAHKGPLGAQAPFSNKSFATLFIYHLDSTHPLHAPPYPALPDTINDSHLEGIRGCYAAYRDTPTDRKQALKFLYGKAITKETADNLIKNLFGQERATLQLAYFERTLLKELDYHLPRCATAINLYARLLFIFDPVQDVGNPTAPPSFDKLVRFARFSFPLDSLSTINVKPIVAPTKLEDLLPAQFDDIAYPVEEPPIDAQTKHAQEIQAQMQSLSSLARKSRVQTERASFSAEQQRLIAQEFTTPQTIQPPIDLPAAIEQTNDQEDTTEKPRLPRY